MARALTDIRSLARKHTAMAIKTLVSIAAQPNAPERARVAAANHLLNRGWGMPKQEVEIGATDALTEVLQAIDGASRGLPQATAANAAKANGANGSIH